MTNIINFPVTGKTQSTNPGFVMMLKREVKGLSVFINLMKLTREELVEVLMPLPSIEKKCEKLDLVRKYINQ